MDLEKIYDDQIAPLMTHIIAIAKEHNMPFVFSFQLTDDDEEGPLMCTSCLLPEGCSEKLVQAKEVLYAPPVSHNADSDRKECRRCCHRYRAYPL